MFFKVSYIRKRVFDKLIPARTMHDIIDNTDISFTSVKHDFSICGKSFIKPHAWNFMAKEQNRSG